MTNFNYVYKTSGVMRSFCVFYNILRPWRNDRNYPDRIFKLILHVGMYIIELSSVSVFEKATGGRLNKKDGLTRYGDSHVKDKTS